MRPLFVALLLTLLFTPPAGAQTASFNLSTNQTFSSSDQPKIHLYTRNVDALEFRIYRVNDPVKFMTNLRDMHSFGREEGPLPAEQIDERTWLEKFHDWKANLWDTIRDFFRHQFSRHARTQLRVHQSKIERHSRIVSEAEFAQVPLLNSSQLVARWRQLTPPTFFTDHNTLPVQKLAPGLYLLEATNGHLKAYTVVIVTDIALVTRSSKSGIIAFVVDRNTGAPIPGATVQSGIGQHSLATATADADGVASLPALTDKSSPDNFYVFASKDSQFAASTPSTWAMTFDPASKFAGYAFTDRPVYRPTHVVHWKAILRERSGNTLVLPTAKTAHVVISDENDKAVFERDMPVTAEGDITGDFTLPADASLGYYTLRIGDQQYGGVTASFHVEDYRKPEYRVSVVAKDKRVLEGQTATVKIDSRYFFGEPVANAKVKYRVYHERNWGWFGEDESDDEDNAAANAYQGTEEDSSNPGDEEAEKTGKLGPDGTMTIQVPTHVDTSGNQHYDLDYVVEAGVTDAANREITGRGRFTATYSTFRIRIEPDRYLVHPGEAVRFNVLAQDYDNKPVSTHVHVQLNYYTWQHGQRQVTNGPSADVQTGADGKARGGIPVTNPPYPYAELDATADAVQPNTPNPTASTSIWIPSSNLYDFSENQTAQILSDKKSYAPGDTAHLSLVSEDAGFYALILVEGDSLQHRQLIHSDTKTANFDVSITSDSQPNVNVSAIFLKNGQLYQASKELKVPPVQKQLQVAITPSKDIFQPQQTVGYDVLTTDNTGKPVAADISFGVVDEAIYSLHPDSSGDMVRTLYPRRFVEANVDSSLDFFFSGTAGDKSPMLAMRNARYRPQLAQVKPGNEAKPRVRKAFPDTAYWAPILHTAADGKAHVSFAFPDSLTTWRATVHAITPDSKAGSAINRVLVRKNVLVRMGTPRFLIQGDEISIPVIAHNYLDTSIEAKISLDVAGLTTISGSPQTVTIPSKGEATVNWRLRATQIGTAKLTASAISGEESDALELTFPVNPAGVVRNSAHSGAVTPQAAQADTTIDFPAGTDPAVHSLRIEISPSIAGSLFSALDYLTSYPYGCTEQTMSSYLPNVIVAESLSRLNVSGHVDPTELRAKMQAGLARLKDYQHDDGGWGWWKEDDSRVYMTAYVVAGLGQGAQFIPLTPDQKQMLQNGQQYLQKALAEHQRMRPDLRAAVVYALAISNADGSLRNALNEQFDRRNDLEPEALAMTGLAMLTVKDDRAQQIAALLESKATHQGALTFWKGSYTPFLDYEYDNSVEATAFAMRLLARVNPGDPLLPGVAQWLMLERNGGYWWYSTEQTAMVLFGLVDYLAASHELDADYTVDILVNGASAGTHHFAAADVTSGASFVLNIDAAHLQPTHNNIQIIRRSGQGRVYWSAVGRYFSTSKTDYQAGTLNLNLTRDYYTLVPTQKDGKIVYALKPFTGTAQVGDVLAVHESISGTPQRYLMVEDPIPAGAEFIANEDSYPIESRPGGWYFWYTRHEYHDDHAAFFADVFTNRQEIFYLIRIVNPGSFTVSPANVEPMYQPGISATTDSLHIDVPVPAPAGGTQ